MPSTTYTLTHSNASIYGNISLDALYGDIIGLGASRMVFAFTGTQLQFYFQHDYPGTGKGLGVKIDGGSETLIQQSGADYNTITTIATGLSEGVHVCEINFDYNSAGAGNTKFKPSSHAVVTGAAPALTYASGYGRAYHTGNNSNAADVYRIGPQLTQSDNGISITSLTGGYNGGAQFAFKSDASSFKVYYSSLAAGTARFTLFDSTGAIVTSGSLANAFTWGEATINTGLSAGTVREYTLGWNIGPTSIVAIGGTMQEGGSKPADRDVMVATTTSIGVSAGSTAWTPEVAGSQLPLLRGCFAHNLGVGGSTLIGTPGTNTTAQERKDEIIAQNPKYVIIEHAANDKGAGTSAATFGAAYQTFLTDLIAACNNLAKIYCAPWWTPYNLDSAYTTAIQSAVAAANTASGTTKCVFIDTSSFRDSVSMYDGVHPDRAGALYAAQQLSAKIQATLDNTAPTLSSVATSTGGVQVTATFSEEMGTGATGFTIKINGTTASQLSATWTSTTTLVFVLARGITSADTVTLDYSAGNVADVAGNALATITGRSVTNNSTVSGGGGSNEMTVTDTIKATLTNTWAEVKDRSNASLTSSAFFIGFANLRGQIVEYAVVDAVENIQIGTEVSSLAPMINAKVVGTGKKLFMRSKSGVSIDIPLEVGTA